MRGVDDDCTSRFIARVIDYLASQEAGDPDHTSAVASVGRHNLRHERRGPSESVDDILAGGSDGAIPMVEMRHAVHIDQVQGRPLLAGQTFDQREDFLGILGGRFSGE